MARTPWFSRSTERLADADSVAVIGLGRFGSALAIELATSGTEVLGVDVDEEIVQAHNGVLTHVARADSTKDDVLRQLSVPEFDRVVVGIGSDLEASILTTSHLLSYGTGRIWAKAISDAHGQILEQLGVHHVIYPEHDMGKRVAHLVRGSMLDFVEFDDGFVMIKTSPPRKFVGVPLGASDLRPQHDVTVVAIRPLGGRWTYASNESVLAADDTIIVAGEVRKAEAFSRLR
ncbi:potassium channel family protein [Oerskovia flava]|uniref:potassium channel family protein n=1 Tax=Oerskovia flava TaxID=2986422 RepID=UPI00223EAC88|nr:TrkA family potassium uptake protein [Oerskovia sp. JB1-3-2]